MGVRGEMIEQLAKMWRIDCDSYSENADTCARIIAARLRTILAIEQYRERERQLEALCAELEGETK